MVINYGSKGLNLSKSKNRINNLFDSSKNAGQFAKGYFKTLGKALSKISSNQINNLVDEFENARKNRKTIFVAGNGGSATTASSMANDIGFDIIKKTSTKTPFKVLALTDNNAVITAIANDVGYENIFVNQLKIHYEDGDKLIVITASGNSPNLIKAAKWVKKKGGKVIGFLGFDGGKVKNLCDTYIHLESESGEYGFVEDCHLMVNHVIAHWFQNKLNKK